MIGGSVTLAMKRGWLLGIAGLAVLALGGAAAWGQGDTKYHAAGISQAAGNIAYPMDVKTPGIVTLDVSVDASGAVQNVSVVRDVPPLTGAAQSAVKGWQFTGASADGQHVAGTVRVNVAFNPFNPGGAGLPGGDLQAPSGGAGGQFAPAGLTKAGYAIYPADTVAGGTVVMKVGVGKSGKVHGVTVVNGAGALGDAATAAVKNWVFTPATYQGGPVASEVVVAFVFANAAAGTR